MGFPSIELTLFLAFFCQVALNTPGIDHHRRPDHHLTQADQASNRYFVVPEGPFQSTNGCFHCGTQMSLALAIGPRKLTTECTIEFGLTEPHTELETWPASRVM